MKLTRVLECGDPAQGRLASSHLAHALAECDRALDPGTLIIFGKLLAQTLKEEQETALGQEQEDFTYSHFMAEEQLAASFARQASTVRAGVGVVLN